jgi:CTP synthase (UTP-ammonia lyase)
MKILAIGDRDQNYLTHRELDAAFRLMPDGVECSWTGTDSPEARDLESADAVWLLPGTPYRDDAVAYAAIDYCRRSGLPFLGTCGGFQYACVELARTLAGIAGAAHAETSPDADDLIVVPLQCSLYGETREVQPVPGTRLAAICGDAAFTGFHWCGYGLDPRNEDRLQSAGVVVSAHAADAGAEAIELPDHPFFIATAFQPQIGASQADVLHPLISALVDAGAEGSGSDTAASAPSFQSSRPSR